MPTFTVKLQRPQVKSNSRRIRKEGGNRNLDKSMFFTGIRNEVFTITVNLQGIRKGGCTFPVNLQGMRNGGCRQGGRERVVVPWQSRPVPSSSLRPSGFTGAQFPPVPASSLQFLGPGVLDSLLMAISKSKTLFFTVNLQGIRNWGGQQGGKFTGYPQRGRSARR